MFDGFEYQENCLKPVNISSSLFFESAQEIFLRVYREIRPGTPPPSIEVEYKQFANPNSNVRLEKGVIAVSITDLLTHAPAPVTEALAHILLGKLYRRPAPRQYAHRYRLYLNRKDIRDRIDALRGERGTKRQSGPQGSTHNLEEVFESLNAKHFGGMMSRPAIGWSTHRSRTRLGHFDPSHNMIVLSRIFDDPRNSQLALEYVMFHEMLHLQYPVDHRGSRRCIHTPEFKAHEKLFPSFKEAKSLLKKLV